MLIVLNPMEFYWLPTCVSVSESNKYNLSVTDRLGLSLVSYIFLHSPTYVLVCLKSVVLPSPAWFPEADSNFNKLRSLFSSAPVLVQPDPSCQFIVEVDESDADV